MHSCPADRAEKVHDVRGRQGCRGRQALGSRVAERRKRMEWIMNIDGNILLFIQENIRTPILTPLLIAITTLGNGGIIWVICSMALLVPKKTRRIGVMSIMALLMSLLINNMILKNLVARTRPYDMVEGLVPLIGKPRDYSFPSGHTGSSFASAWVLYRQLPGKFGIPALVLAGLIGLSRLYVGVHYPTDVLFGVLGGIVSGAIAMLIFRGMEKAD